MAAVIIVYRASYPYEVSYHWNLHFVRVPFFSTTNRHRLITYPGMSKILPNALIFILRWVFEMAIV